MSVDSSIALITLDEAKVWLGIETEQTESEQALLESVINTVSKWIENFCQRKFITPAADITELFDGDGTCEYYVKNSPISGTIAAADISYRSGTGETWTATTASFNYDRENGRIYFTDGNIFHKGKDNWKVVYAYGYTVDNVPDDLKAACIELVALKKKQFEDGSHGLNSRSFGDQTTNFTYDRIPNTVQALLAPYRRLW